MENLNYAIVQIIQNSLGRPKSEVDALNKEQWQFNCLSPTCRHDSEKYNLEYHAEKKVFKCWKCGYYGYVYTLVKDYGSKDDYSRLKVLLPFDNSKKFKDQEHKKPKADHHLVTCKLPEGYFPLGKNRNTPLYKLAWDYCVKERKVSPAFIDKYQIGYTETGNRRFRIIIPSRNALGNFNYYEARSYMKGPKEIPYIKPSSKEVHKNDIIFNEYFINWDLPVFLVEGPFDMFRVPNSIPVLGKEMSPLLIDQLMKNAKTVILCLDPDAMEKTVEYYTLLSSLGLEVFFIDLVDYNKDISKIYEDHGKEEVARVLVDKLRKNLDLSIEVKKKLKDE